MNQENYSLSLISAPAGEPLTVAEVYKHSRVPEEEDSDYVAALIVAARQYFEDHDSRRLCSQTWKLALDRFPTCWGQYDSYYSSIEIPLRPVQSISHIKYRDADGILQTLDPSAYQVDLTSFIARVAPAYNTFWPATRCVMNAVEIQFVCGYGTAVSIPDPDFDDYFLTFEPSWSTTVTASSKTVNGFHAEFSTAAPAGATLGVLAQGGTPLQTLANFSVDVDENALEADIDFPSTLPTPGTIVGGIPQHLKQALLLHIGHMYENRENSAVVPNMVTIPMGYDALIGANRRLHV